MFQPGFMSHKVVGQDNIVSILPIDIPLKVHKICCAICLLISEPLLYLGSRMHYQQHDSSPGSPEY